MQRMQYRFNLWDLKTDQGQDDNIIKQCKDNNNADILGFFCTDST